MEEAAGTSLYKTKMEEALSHIKKKELKLDEIKKIIEADVGPKLTRLEVDMENYNNFKL